MATTAKSRIDLNRPIRTREALASEAMLPGHIVEYVSTGKVQKNDRAGDRLVGKMIALQKEYDGQGINAGDHGTYSYAADDQVVIGVFGNGSEVLLRVPAAAAAIVIGDHLETVAGGTVQKLAAVGNIPFAVALEAVDNSGGGSEVCIKALLV